MYRSYSKLFWKLFKVIHLFFHCFHIFLGITILHTSPRRRSLDLKSNPFSTNIIHLPYSLIFSHDSHDTPSVLGTKHQGLIPLILVPPHLVRSPPWNYRTIILLFSLSLKCLNMILWVHVARPCCHSKWRTLKNHLRLNDSCLWERN